MGKNGNIGDDLVNALDDTNKGALTALRRTVGGKKKSKGKTKKRLRRVEKQLDELTQLLHQVTQKNAAR